MSILCFSDQIEIYGTKYKPGLNSFLFVSTWWCRFPNAWVFAENLVHWRIWLLFCIECLWHHKVWWKLKCIQDWRTRTCLWLWSSKSCTAKRPSRLSCLQTFWWTFYWYKDEHCCQCLTNFLARVFTLLMLCLKCIMQYHYI